MILLIVKLWLHMYQFEHSNGWWSGRNAANICLMEDILQTSWRRLLSLSSEDNIFKTSSRRLDEDDYIHLDHTFSEDVFKTPWSWGIYSPWSYTFKTSSRYLQDVFKTSSRRLQDVFKISSKRLQDVPLKIDWSC